MSAFIVIFLGYHNPMRGTANFNSLFSDILPELTKQEGKGRSPDLNARRDELILYRYFFYGANTPYRYDLIISTLSEEFFLSERRIQDIISTHAILLRQLRQKPPVLTQLKEKYPHLIWRPVMAPAPKAIPIHL